MLEFEEVFLVVESVAHDLVQLIALLNELLLLRSLEVVLRLIGPLRVQPLLPRRCRGRTPSQRIHDFSF